MEEDQSRYAKCVNDECRYKGFAFAPPPNQEGERVCPSCGSPLERWKSKEQREREQRRD